ncbi:HYR-like domain-containing protein [Gelidibacter salicanalis]|uniref:Gliding motility-associated C-terminal domain-containing protein n=1 Tax=Gelidibacter salicanalis TaxID=291193 RepID=A0A934KYH0_9FLAO|nr:gliding motility-associated C-terminal domain-containing protein [Gelidibacter salicanalis]MBJ7882743.1 gliding motility-associated C-terminal domain-containing protein [Gelidibacter salicanalis]
MKKLYTEKINNIKPILQLVLVVVLALAPSVFTQAQVKVEFTPRASAFTPNKTVYNVKGDFTMLGNTNLTLVDYDDNGNNSEDMAYVDVDNDNATWNSSAASLNLSDQISPECTNIVYAGLYWTGRSTGDNEFTVTKEFATGKTITENISDDAEVFNGQAIPNTTYGLAITNSTTLATYTFTSTAGGNTVKFFLYKGYNDDKTYLKVSVNNGPQTDVATSSLTNANVILKTPYTIFSGSDYALKIKRLEVLPQNRAHVNISYTSTYNETVERTKSFNKRKVSIKGPNATNYTQLTAHATDIYYPSGTDNDIFSAYVDVTDYVKNNGNNGLYHVADIALVEGDGDGIGFYGGWGMVVVYENSEMSWKDVTVFDGHAFVDSSITISHFLDVSGFNTTQQGPVKVKLGVMAGEGDRTIAGDYFKIRRTSDNAFESLAHSGNSLTNFFNSSIQTPGVRIPYLLNNTGMDISMFDLDNEDKAIINNNQTSTRFEYGSTQDTYAIFNITVAVDSYIPESEGLLSLVDIAGNPATAPYVALPGDELQYNLEIRNKGSEPIQNAKLVIPIPFTSQFVPGSIIFNEYDSLFNATAPYYDPNEGATGAIVWDIAYLPLDTDVTKLLANLRFKLKTTEDCSILVNDGCAPKIVILGGYISGTGANSGIVYSLPLIQGYDQNGICEGIPNTDPIVVDIDAEQYILDNCANVSLTRTFLYCNLENNSIPVSEIAAQFPPGSLFYNSFPVTDASIQFTASNPFPATKGQSTYYAIPPGVTSCTYTFTIEVNDITSSPTVANVEYCLNQTANPLSAQASNPDYTVFYYADNNPNTVGQSSLVPDTSVKGTFTYYASEGPAENCVNPNRTPFTVTVNDGLTINLVEQVNDSCSNLNSGSLSISTTGGSGNFTYAWDFNGTPIATTQNINNLAEGTYSVTVSDADSDCTTTKSFVIITENTSPIEINAPAALLVNGCTVDDITINNTASLAYSASVSTIGIAKFLSEGGTFTGDGITTVTYSDTTSGTCPLIVTRTFTITDTCNQAASTTQTITIENTTPPTLVTPEAKTVECGASIEPSATGTATVTDACGSVEITYVDASVESCGETETITRTWTATDACGNASTGTQLITVVDTTAPVLTLPLDTTVECSESMAPFATGLATATDTCSEVAITYVDAAVAACGTTQIITRTWTATDACGNAVTGDQIINVVDTVAPVITAPEDVTLECSGLSRMSGSGFGEATATDGCGEVVITFEDSAIAGCGNTQSITRTWTATDECGNTASTSQTITVVDTTAPIIAAPKDILVECSESIDPSVTGTPDAFDACGGVKVTYADVDAYDTCGNTKIIERTWTATDDCGLTSTATQFLTIVDTTAPVIETPAENVVLNCNAEGNTGSLTAWLTNNGGATASDSCSTDLTWTNNYDGGGSDCNEPVTVIFTVTDACGNASTTTATYTIQDSVAPVLTPASNFTAECISEGTMSDFQNWLETNGGATASDVCSAVIWSNDFIALSEECNSTGTITFTATDGCGNSSTTTATYTITDTTAPVIETLPGETTVDCSVTPTFVQAIATDECGSDITLTFDDVTTDGNCEGAYAITRTWTATDACGNASTASQTINVQDTTAPSLVTQYESEITLACDNIPTAPNLVFEDSCSNTINVAFNETSTAAEGVENYVITRTWTVSDTCNNEAVYTQIINVNAAPVITVTDTELCNGDDLNFNLFDLLNGTFDTNGTWSVVTGNASLDGSIFNPYQLELGTYTFKYTLADDYCTSEAFVNIRLHDDCVVLPCGAEDVIISKAVTTYTDGKNDFFTVTGVETCGFTVELQIFNRWGAMIYESKNYQNDWNGTSSKASVGNSNYVPTGTYYYVINLRNSGLKPFAGPIYVATK